MLRRMSSHSPAARALPTRKRVFKEHIAKLQRQDPERWTPNALARHLGVPVENVQAVLKLRELAAASEEADKEWITLADDAEEYLDSDYADPPKVATPATTSTAPSPSSTAELNLGQMSIEMEQGLVGAVAARLGGRHDEASATLAASVRGALDGLSTDELEALTAQLPGARATAAPQAAADGAASSLDAPATPPGGGADGGGAAAPPGLGPHPDTPRGRAVGMLAQMITAGALPTAAAGGGEGSRPFWVDPTAAAAAPITTTTPAAAAELSADELHSVEAPDFGDTLAARAELRGRRLAPDAQHWPPRNERRMVFTELGLSGDSQKKRSATRVWVAEAAADHSTALRAPTAEEEQRAKIIAKPPILRPRIKRNM